MSSKEGTETADLRCSFCDKDQNAVRKLIAGPRVSICDECVEVCNDIIADDNKSSGAAEIHVGSRTLDGPVSGSAVQCSLCRMPTIVRDGLPIHNRGFVCFGCIGEIEAANAERRESGA